ncbi:uncharacterized protein BBA_03968 [Beauveria bassiana ARSEF 2860]|uniref:Uncharacterized protein n=1 Tax=Beauveria bassiana (strain ARSEF 2860) TaxID=655819 RepID=J4KPG1_BEAB2|nr:uncharacterized protein BBA_03968 [Beauveria bassiana ARSEF 2860]EJP67394.1 hypothetical protein BBA_03968 [Beauveria bassiana ARSEF 2860]
MHMHSTAQPNANINSSLYGCGTNGGQMGVTADLSNPLYNAPEYKNSGAKPEGIIIKIVARLPDHLVLRTLTFDSSIAKPQKPDTENIDHAPKSPGILFSVHFRTAWSSNITGLSSSK